jgi:hypothetical protein
MPFVADRSLTSGRSAYRDVLADRLLWRLTVVGAAALGFLATFLLLDHEIRLLKNVILPLLALLPVYLILMSVNTWWAAKVMAKQGLTPRPRAPRGSYRFRVERLLTAGCGLAFGVLAALWYVHSVSK